jgi:hypothetical protein
MFLPDREPTTNLLRRSHSGKPPSRGTMNPMLSAPAQRAQIAWCIEFYRPLSIARWRLSRGFWRRLYLPLIATHSQPAHKTFWIGFRSTANLEPPRMNWTLSHGPIWKLQALPSKVNAAARPGISARASNVVRGSFQNVSVRSFTRLIVGFVGIATTPGDTRTCFEWLGRYENKRGYRRLFYKAPPIWIRQARKHVFADSACWPGTLAVPSRAVASDPPRLEPPSVHLADRSGRTDQPTRTSLCSVGTYQRNYIFCLL